MTFLSNILVVVVVVVVVGCRKSNSFFSELENEYLGSYVGSICYLSHIKEEGYFERMFLIIHWDFEKCTKYLLEMGERRI